MKLTELISTDLMRHLGLVLEMDVYRSLAARLGLRGHEMSKERRERQNYGMQSVHVLQYMLNGHNQRNIQFGFCTDHE